MGNQPRLETNADHKDGSQTMKWHNLLCDERLERPDAAKPIDRSSFQQDLDRIVFSTAFRRLAHKTQVHPLADDDHVHTRLTHSIEVASIGRSLGTMVGQHIGKLEGLENSADSLGYIVQAACLAHDIGNPPFGHSGEDSICEWFKKYFKNKNHREEMQGTQKNDFLNFEGNAQGFRILTQIENNKDNGGLQLTHAVLGTYMKYPHSSRVHPLQGSRYIGCKKVGYFHSEERYVFDIAQSLGLIKHEDYWCRHPLAFLVEAADDICYAIIDIEDGYNLNYLNYSMVQDVFSDFVAECDVGCASLPDNEKVAKWRAVAIGKLVEAVAKTFIEKETALLNGTFCDELIAHTDYKKAVENAKNAAKREIFWSDKKSQIEIAAHEILSGLLSIFVPVVSELALADWNADKLRGQTQKLARLCSTDNFHGVTTHYEAMLRITDFISGMTDRYALNLYRKLKGISL